MPEPEVELSHISMVEKGNGATTKMAAPTCRHQDGGIHMASSRWRCQDGDIKMTVLAQAGCERVDGRRQNDSEQSARFAFSPRKQAGLRAGPLAARPVATVSARGGVRGSQLTLLACTPVHRCPGRRQRCRARVVGGKPCETCSRLMRRCAAVPTGPVNTWTVGGRSSPGALPIAN
jgi:hypothetical protein